jgi:hypothetical protein
VGSEMCIRDSSITLIGANKLRHHTSDGAEVGKKV